MAFCPGTAAYVTVGGTTRTFDQWSVSTSADAADVADYDRREARWLTGEPICRIVMSGPYNQGGLGMVIGTEYAVVFGVSGTMGLALTVLVTNVGPSTKAKDAARIEVSGVVNSAFLSVVSVL